MLQGIGQPQGDKSYRIERTTPSTNQGGFMSHIEIVQLFDSYVLLATHIIFLIIAYCKLIAVLSRRS